MTHVSMLIVRLVEYYTCTKQNSKGISILSVFKYFFFKLISKQSHAFNG